MNAPTPLASWILFLAQLAMALLAIVFLGYGLISQWRSNRRWKAREADMDRKSEELHQRLMATVPVPTRPERRADA